MKKKIFITLLALISAFSIASCGKDSKKGSQITGDGADIQASSGTNAATGSSGAAAPVTLAPAATLKPDAAEKAQEKVSANDGETNAVVVDENGERSVDIKFSLENHTGLDFMALLLAPVTDEIALPGNNVLPDGQTFPDGQSITLNPGNAAQLPTTLFNIAAVDSESRGYVFQNIDLATSNVIQLYIEDGIPKAVIK